MGVGDGVGVVLGVLLIFCFLFSRRREMRYTGGCPQIISRNRTANDPTCHFSFRYHLKIPLMRLRIMRLQKRVISLTVEKIMHKNTLLWWCIANTYINLTPIKIRRDYKDKKGNASNVYSTRCKVSDTQDAASKRMLSRHDG